MNSAASSAGQPARPQRPRTSLYRRLLGGSGLAGADGMPDTLEAELAERLDTVLNIAERLAATHDRHELLRTIVDETRRALRVDYVTIRVVEDDQLVIAAWAGLPEEVARALPAIGVAEGWVGEVLQTGQMAAWSDTRSDPRHGAERPEGIVETAGDLIAPIVDETRRALRVDYVTIRIVEDGRLVVAAWAGLSDEVARALPGVRGR